MPKINTKKQPSAYIVTVNMGYGHQRAAYPLTDIAALSQAIPLPNGTAVIAANDYPGILTSDQKKWDSSQSLYETISRMKKIPLIGQPIFDVMDYLQRIKEYYPKRDLSVQSLQLKGIYQLIQKGWGKDLIDKLNEHPLPYITTFFTTAFFAEEHGYKGDIYCICTDNDVSRAWAPMDAPNTRIQYFAPNPRVKQRLMMYGVPEKNIRVTGFPLPKENIGKAESILKKSLADRLALLDPQNIYRTKYASLIQDHLGVTAMKKNPKRPVTIAFAVGGAGAQKEMGVVAMNSLSDSIKKGTIKLLLVAGSRPEIKEYFEDEIQKAGLKKHVEVLFHAEKVEYFKLFNQALLTTDIIWTKPSELSFYAGLGLPILMAPTIGSQEVYNKAWLERMGAGIPQEDPQFTHEWLTDLLNSGVFAQAAMNGFLQAPRNAAYEIEEIIS